MNEHKLLKSAKYVRRELCIRLGRAVSVGECLRVCLCVATHALVCCSSVLLERMPLTPCLPRLSLSFSSSFASKHTAFVTFNHYRLSWGRIQRLRRFIDSMRKHSRFFGMLSTASEARASSDASVVVAVIVLTNLCTCMPHIMFCHVRSSLNLPTTFNSTTFIDAPCCATRHVARTFPDITTLAHNHRFTHILRTQLAAHMTVIPLLAAAARECSVHMMREEDMDRFMDDMLRTRIGRRVLAEQHIALTEGFERDRARSTSGANSAPREGGNLRRSTTMRKTPAQVADPRHIGIIDTRCHAGDTLRKCIALARESVARMYGGHCVPEVAIDGHTEVGLADL